LKKKDGFKRGIITAGSSHRSDLYRFDCSILIQIPFLYRTNMSSEAEIATINADGVDIFYRSAGSMSAPVVLLLHGFPSSSHMFRNLIPLLSTQYRVIAPDLPGFGFTIVPEERKYNYTFANIATTIEALLDSLGIEKFAVYIFDYGAPTAFRIALNRPHAITAIVTQNGNAYEEGLGAEFWAPLQQYWATGDVEAREKIRNAALNFETTKWQYTFGSPHPQSVPPETYHLDTALMLRPGNQDIQLDILYDYRTNIAVYPKFHEYLRSSGVPVLVVWGKNDPIFVPAGAEGFRKDVKDLQVRYLNAPHFALETNEVEMAELMITFFEKRGI
jgi:pimeloyl-ACP methyl ester carboxylesterase